MEAIAHRYAGALFEVAEAEGALAPVWDSVQFLSEVLTEPVLQMLSEPVLPVETKQQLVQEVLGDAVHPLVMQTVLLMIENFRSEALMGLSAAFGELRDKALQILRAELTTASPISDHLKQQIETKVGQLYGFEQVVLENTVNAQLLGGAILKIQDKVMDASIQGRLQAIEKQVLGQ